MAHSSAPSAAASSKLYGIAKSPIALDYLRGNTASIESTLNNAIEQLRFNPRPPTAEVMPGSALMMQNLVISSGPKWWLVYSVDDAKEKVIIFAIQPAVV